MHCIWPDGDKLNRSSRHLQELNSRDEKMSQIAQNVKTLVARPNLALPFLKYFILKNVLGLKPTRRFAGNVRIRCFANFSEYHSCSRAIADRELRFLDQF